MKPYVSLNVENSIGTIEFFHPQSNSLPSDILKKISVVPKPYQKPHPPIWVAALQPSTYEIAAAKGIGVLAFGSSAPSSLAPHAIGIMAKQNAISVTQWIRAEDIRL